MNLYKEIQNIKIERDIFINSFNPLNLTEEDVINTCENINLQSIRVHKYLTSTGDIGKVATAKFLSSINLDENSRFTDIDKKQIKLIIEYINT